MGFQTLFKFVKCCQNVYLITMEGAMDPSTPSMDPLVNKLK